MIVGRRDTIAAIATPSGAGGIGIVRISGPDAAVLAGRLLGRAPESFPDRKLVHGQARDREGHRIDDVLAVVMRGPRSFTGEDVAEIHGHGGVMNMARLLRAVVADGARPADAGEFTRRAFENGKLDLARAEAIVDVIEAGSERALRLAQAQLDGRLGTRLSEFRARATDLLAEVEACIDFPEEGEAYLGSLHIADKARALGDDVFRLARTFTLGRALRNGVEIAIVGEVNAGKSSLFNALLDTDRAIVDAHPGTTRDYVEAQVVWAGIPVTLIDTAGERHTENRVENLGIERGRRRASEADLRLCVHSVEQLNEDPTHEGVPTPTLSEYGEYGDPRVLHVLTKVDLLDLPDDARSNASRDGEVNPNLLWTSAHSGIGIEPLKSAALTRVCGPSVESDDGHVVTSERHRALLGKAAASLVRVVEGVDGGQPTEVLAIEIRETAQCLAQILGEEVGEEVLDSLFSRFCIGK